MTQYLKHIYLIAALISSLTGSYTPGYAQRVENISSHYLKGVPELSSRAQSPNPFAYPEYANPELIAFEISDNEKSKALAGFYSFLIPGLGEAYAGNFSIGKYSMGMEAALVTGLISTIVYANSLESDYQNLARTYAGVSGSSKTEQYWKDISNYKSWESYNQERLQQRNYNALYENEDYWSWESERQRKTYRQKRISSDQAFQSAYYFLAAMGLNRLISMINAVRSTAEFNNNLTQGIKLNLSPVMVLNKKYIMNGVKISLRKTF
jgi:hypothetical protein